MRYVLLIIFVLFSNFAFSQVYKCTIQGGTLSFSDKPCQAGQNQQKIFEKQQNSNWISQLKVQTTFSITITDIVKKDGDTIIKYTFLTREDSNNFIRLVNKLSKTNVVLSKHVQPKNSKVGNAEVKVTNKPNPLFDNLNVSS